MTTAARFSKLATALILGLSLSACAGTVEHSASNDMLYTAAYHSGADYSAIPNHVANYPDLVNWQE